MPDNHPLALAADENALRTFFREADGRSPSTASDFTRQLIDFYHASDDTLWVTFAQGFMWWCFAKPGVILDEKDKSIRYRQTVDGWHKTSIGGKLLNMVELNGNLTKTAMYRSAICQIYPDQFDYLIRKINDEERPVVVAAQRARASVLGCIVALMQELQPGDFEILTDIVFTQSVWRRLGAVGKTQKTVDMEIELPSTGERAFNDPTWLKANLHPTSLDQLKLWQEKANDLETMWSSTSVTRRQLTIRSFLKRIVLSADGLSIDIALTSLMALLNGDSSEDQPAAGEVLTLQIRAKLKSLGKEKRLIIHGENHHKGEPNPELVKAISLGHSWRQMLVSGQFTSLKGLAENLKLADTHVGRYIQLGLLAPDIVEAILAGNQPLGLTVRKLYNVTSTDWPMQRRQLGFSA